MCPDEAAQTGTPFETSASRSQQDSLAVVSRATWTSKILLTFPHSTATTVSPYLAHLLTEDFLNDFSAVVCLPCLRVLDLDSVVVEAIVLVRGHSPSLYPARDCDCVRGDDQFYCRLSVCCRDCRGRLWAIQAGLEASSLAVSVVSSKVDFLVHWGVSIYVKFIHPQFISPSLSGRQLSRIMSTSGIATIDPKTQGGEVEKLSIPLSNKFR